MPKRQALKNVSSASWLFGHPVLRADNSSIAYWARPTISPNYQKGGGWMPCLYGGVQSGVDWAAIYIPVNEYPVSHFTDAQWSYYMTAVERIGVNIVIWVHDADDFDKRAEITQIGSHNDLEKAAGWNAFEFTASTSGMFFYGENTTGTTLTAGTQYTWSQFQADNLFKDWVIYRISLEYGWDTTATADHVFVSEIKLNGVPIPLKPNETDTDPIHQYITGASAINAALSPKTPFRLLNIMLHLNAVATQQTFTLTCDAGRVATVYDTLLYSQAMAGIRDIVVPFGEGYEFLEEDEIDAAWTNSDTKTYGLTYTFQTVF